MVYFVVGMQRQTNDKKTVSFRLDAQTVAQLDELAEAQARDRTFLLNEAVSAYLDTQRWQIEHIQEGVRQADAGMGAPHQQVVARWRRRLR
jgi:predicted transcriptional regulator